MPLFGQGVMRGVSRTSQNLGFRLDDIKLDHQETDDHQNNKDDPHPSDNCANGRKPFPVFNDSSDRKANHAANQSDEAPACEIEHSDPFP